MRDHPSVCLKLEGLSVGYQRQPVLPPLTLNVEKGDVIAIIGPNGAGKSTILKTLSRQLKSLGGSVFLEGKRLDTYNTQELALRQSVVLPQQVRPELMTCRDVVAAGRYPHTGALGILTDEDRRFIEKAIDAMHVHNIAGHRFDSVSDGQRQRVLIARALCQDPQVLILDEPTAYLDLRYRLHLFSLLRSCARQGMTIIMSVHEIDLAQKVATKLICVGARECHVMTPDEFSESSYATSLFDIQDGSYDERLGFMELPKIEGTAHTFVISAAGSGIPVYRSLQRKGIPFAAGILYTNDVDFLVAQALAVRVVTERPFEAIGDDAFEAACRCIDGCERVIVCDMPIGSCNRRIRDLIGYAGGKRWHGPL